MPGCVCGGGQRGNQPPGQNEDDARAQRRGRGGRRGLISVCSIKSMCWELRHLISMTLSCTSAHSGLGEAD